MREFLSEWERPKAKAGNEKPAKAGSNRDFVGRYPTLKRGANEGKPAEAGCSSTNATLQPPLGGLVFIAGGFEPLATPED